MATYIEEFQTRVRKSHRDQAKYCHWTKYEELFDPPPVANAKGPCDCPSHKGTADPCSPHRCHKCASTEDVLGMNPASKGHYAKSLDELKAANDELTTGIEKGDETYKKARASGMSPEDALTSPSFSFMYTGYWGDNSPERKAVLKIADLELDVLPSDDFVEAGCECECFDNKRARLQEEEKKLAELIAEAKTMSVAIRTAAKNLKATPFNTVIPVIKGSIKVVAGAFKGDVGKAVDGAKELFEYLKASAADGAKVYALLKAARALSEIKRVGMLGIIYHDQQLAAPTCGPSSQSGAGMGSGSTDEPVTDNPPADGGSSTADLPSEDVPIAFDATVVDLRNALEMPDEAWERGHLEEISRLATRARELADRMNKG